MDKDFGVNVSWDVPMLEGYENRFLQRDGFKGDKFRFKPFDAKKKLSEGNFDSILIQGYVHSFERKVVESAKALGLQTILRAEFTDVGYRRGLLKSTARNLYLRWFYKKIDSFCYIGENARLHLKKRNIAEDNLFFSPYSIDSQLFEIQKQTYNRSDSRKELGLGREDFVFIFTGKLIKRKGVLDLAEALSNIKNIKNISLIMVGDGPLRDTFESKVRPLLQDKLIMAGFVNQSRIGFYYRAADAFLLPAEYDTWGLVVNEAMQFALPVIVSEKVGCHKDLVFENTTGYVFSVNNPVALAEKIEKMAHDPVKSKKMGQSAVKLIEKYSTQSAVEGIVEALGIKS
jgi:glycosyltransferase involved in cell wall biosynthesis